MKVPRLDYIVHKTTMPKCYCTFWSQADLEWWQVMTKHSGGQRWVLWWGWCTCKHSDAQIWEWSECEVVRMVRNLILSEGGLYSGVKVLWGSWAFMRMLPWLADRHLIKIIRWWSSEGCYMC